mgnify:CR=1 FL=1
MRYLFFDIEASDGNYGVCEFGVVITDEKFNTTYQKLYLINPKKKFNTVGRHGRPDVNLSFPKEEYLKAPEYDEVYENIKYCLEQKDIMVFGHAVDNDINYLRKACDRYKLPYINFDAYDVQRMFSYFGKERRKFASLVSVIEELIPEEERNKLIEHRSVDDAYMTMLTLKAMLAELGFSVNDMIDVCKGCKIISKDFIERIKAKEKDKREHHELYTKTGHRCEPAQVAWGEFYRSQLPLLEQESSIGKICGISKTIKESLDTTNAVIEMIKSRNLVAFDKINGADYLVVKDEDDKERLLKTFRYPFNGKMVLLDDFLNKKCNL